MSEDDPEELGLRAEHWCMYHRDDNAHRFGVNGRCHGCGVKEAKK